MNDSMQLELGAPARPEPAATAAEEMAGASVRVQELNLYYDGVQALKRTARSRRSSAPAVAASRPCCAASTA
ncbi:MAG: hypothetical protein MUE63_11850 [Xanthomonadales bacterium]|nr:hypothetical protein [Xanthomonadales bacterium]